MKAIKKMRIRQRILLIAVVVIVSIVIYLSFIFKRDSEAAIERFAKYEAKAVHIETSYGKLSYIDEGRGEVILCCHGICGGYDQAYDVLADKTDNYRVIAPSRFGYPGSDMPRDATIELQATAYKELLDQLGIEKAYILATSAGGTSAIKFALMYPERTKGLILYCSGYPRWEAPEQKIAVAGPPAFFCSDLAMWLISPFFEQIMGMDRSTIHFIMPMEDKKEGILFDGKVTNTVMYNNYTEYDMSKLIVPVLMFHAKNDQLASFDGVKPWVDKIKNCTFEFFESGGHLMEGNGERIDQVVQEFIEKNK